MKRTLLTACVIVLTGCLAMPVLARGGSHGGGRGGGGRGGGHAVAGNRGGGGHYGGGYGRGGYGRGGYGGYGYGGYGYGGYGLFGGGLLPWLGLGWGPYYGGYYDNVPYVNDYGPYVNGPVNYAPNYLTPLPQTPMPVPTAAPATLEVLVPNPQAQIWIDADHTTSTGTDRIFQTPPLAPGSTYAYHLRAVWMNGLLPTIVNRQVQVTPGSRTVIDLGNQATPTSSPSNMIATN